MSGLPQIALLFADAPSILPLFGLPQWGLFGQDGSPILVSDSVGSVEFYRKYEISKYPQEGLSAISASAFASYNKVQEPYDAKVTILSSLTRAVLFATIEPIVASLQLVTVVMPEWSYPSANLTGYDFRRTSRNGVSLIAVDVSCEEVRIASSAQPVGSFNPNAAQSASSGLTSAAPFFIPGTDTVLSTGSTNAAFPIFSGSVTPTQSSDVPSLSNVPPPT